MRSPGFRPVTFSSTLLPTFGVLGVAVAVAPAPSATGVIASAHTRAARARNLFEIPMLRVLLDVVPTYQRLVAVGIGLFLVTGCGDKGLDKPLPAVTSGLKVSMPWRDGERIPQQYTCDGANRKPAVRVTGASSHPVAIVMTDPDAP